MKILYITVNIIINIMFNFLPLNVTHCSFKLAKLKHICLMTSAKQCSVLTGKV